MTKRNTTKSANSLIKTEKQFKEFLESNNVVFYKTGSRLFGVHTKDSDYDYLILQRQLKKIENKIHITLHQLRPTSGYEGMALRYIELPFGEVNLIVLDKNALCAWVKATEYFRNKCEKSRVFKRRIKDRAARVRLFKQLRDFIQESEY